MRYVPNFGIIPFCLLIDTDFVTVLMIKRTSRYVAIEYRPRHLSWVVFFSVPSYEYYYNRPLPLLHTFFPTHSSLLFYNFTIFGLHYIQNCKSQTRQNIRSSLFCDVSRRRVVASNRRFGTTPASPWRINKFIEIRCRLTSILVGSLTCFTTVRNSLFAHRMKEEAANSTSVPSNKSEAYHVHNRLKTDPDISPLIHIRALHLLYSRSYLHTCIFA